MRNAECPEFGMRNAECGTEKPSIYRRDHEKATGSESARVGVLFDRGGQGRTNALRSAQGLEALSYLLAAG